MISKQFKQSPHDVSMKNPCPKTTNLQQQCLSPEVEANKITLIKKKKNGGISLLGCVEEIVNSHGKSPQFQPLHRHQYHRWLTSL